MAIVLKTELFGIPHRVAPGYYDDTCRFIDEKLLSSCNGNYMVYRISFVCFVFYFSQACMISPLFVRFIRHPPTLKVLLSIQYYYQCLKGTLFVFLLIVSFFIPNHFFYAFAWFTLISSAIFIAIQMLLIIDWSFEWQESWLEKGSNDDDDELFDDDHASCFANMTIWKWLMLLFSAIFTLIGLVLFVLEIVLFGSRGPCHLNRFFICFSLVLGGIVTIISLVSGKGILPSSIVFCFGMFSVLSALLSQPSEYGCSLLAKSHEGGHWWMNIVSGIFMVFVAAFSLIRTAFMTSLSAAKMFRLKHQEANDSYDDIDADAYSDISDDSEVGGEYSEEDIQKLHTQSSQMYWYHIVFTLASCFMAMVLTNWTVEWPHGYQPHHNDDWSQSDVSWVAVWIKIVGGWLMYGLFVWACVAPIVLSRWRHFE